MKRTLAILVGLLVSIASVADVTPTHLPSALLFSDKPINPLCFAGYGVVSAKSKSVYKVDLKKCTQDADAATPIKKDVTNGTQGDFIGFSYSESEDAYFSSIKYQFFDAGNDQYWIYSINFEVGSRTSMQFFLVKRKDANILEVEEINQNSWDDIPQDPISQPEQHDHQLFVTVGLTPLVFGTGERIDGYEDSQRYGIIELQDEAGYSAGYLLKEYVAGYVYKLDTKEPTKPQFDHIELLTPPGRAKIKEINPGKAKEYLEKAKEENRAYQKEVDADHDSPPINLLGDCLSDVISAFIYEGKSKLDLAGYKQFLQKFNEICPVKEELDTYDLSFSDFARVNILAEDEDMSHFLSKDVSSELSTTALIIGSVVNVYPRGKDGKAAEKSEFKYIELSAAKEITSIDLVKAKEYLKKAEKENTLQDCLQDIAKASVYTGKSKLDSAEWKQFVKNFDEICIKKATKN